MSISCLILVEFNNFTIKMLIGCVYVDNWYLGFYLQDRLSLCEGKLERFSDWNKGNVLFFTVIALIKSCLPISVLG